MNLGSHVVNHRPFNQKSLSGTERGHRVQARLSVPHDRLDQFGALFPFERGASNQWVIAGAHTATGAPILANDPHLGIAAPIVWYLVRIVTPQGWVKGASLRVVKIPRVLFVHN